jgi:aspartate-semialdehyde dehydrogenase
MKLVLIGATGLVGREMIRVMEEFRLPVESLIPVASEKSVGKTVDFLNQQIPVIQIHEALLLNPNIVLYSAGSEISLKTAHLFSEKGAYVIDNSSAWRMDKNVPLVVPEVNIGSLRRESRIIANPNCSTIQLVVALSPIYRKYGLKKIVISTYQSVTGTGAAAVKQLMNERKGIGTNKVYPHQIDLNCFPQGGTFLENGFTTEEMKLVHETHKILDDDSIAIEATVVRIPVIGGHSESVFVECDSAIDISAVRVLLSGSQGIIVQDNVTENEYPMPISVQGKNETFVGRIRPGLSGNNTLHMWIVADNLRKGAATNAVQIAQYISENYL